MTTRIKFIGDVHGNYNNYFSHLEEAEKEGMRTVQVGDFGIGFVDNPAEVYYRIVSLEIHNYNASEFLPEPDESLLEVKNSQDFKWSEHKFIRGNHDKPELCKSQSNWIEDGYTDIIDGVKVMYIGGAFSIDADRRIEGVDWWRDEELNTYEWDVIIERYEKFKPDLMITHDAPRHVVEKMYNERPQRYPSTTTRALDALHCIHHPKLWIFGHHHRPYYNVLDGTKFLCLDVDDFVDIELDEGEIKLA